MTQPVIGDVAGMRAAASQLRYRAEEFTRLAATVDARVESMTYTGPAATRWRSAVADQGANLRSAGQRLQAVADALMRSAADVEAQQRLQQLTAGGL